MPDRVGFGWQSTFERGGANRAAVALKSIKGNALCGLRRPNLQFEIWESSQFCMITSENPKTFRSAAKFQANTARN